MNYTQQDWGIDLVWANTTSYSARTMILKEANTTPYLYHKKRTKTLFILQGVVKLIVEGQSKLLAQGESFQILPKIMHSITALKGDATILEAGTQILENDTVVVEE